MLSKKLSKKAVLTVVKKPRLQIVSAETNSHSPVIKQPEQENVLPVRNEFNSGYLKPKKHDPL